jgi:hypothetical protein
MVLLVQNEAVAVIEVVAVAWVFEVVKMILAT